MIDENIEEEILHSVLRLRDHFREGQYESAIDSAENASSLIRKYFGESHPKYIQSLNTLASLYRTMGKYAMAEPLYEQILDVRRKDPGENHPAYAESLNDLGMIYLAMGNYDKAESSFLEALNVRRATLGEIHPDYILSLNNLGGLYRHRGDHVEAERFFREALDIRRRAPQEKDSGYASSLNNLAVLYHDMGNYSEAERLLRQSLEIRRSTLGEGDSDYAQSLNNLGLLYHDMGNYSEAEPLYRQALEINRRAIGENHPDYVINLNNLALLCGDMGDHVEAERLYLKALEVARHTVGEDHPYYAQSLHNLAGLYYLGGHYAEAESLYEHVLDVRRTSLGENHPYYAQSLSNMANLYAAIGREADALKLMRKAEDIDERTRGQVFTVCSERQRMAYIATLQGGLSCLISLAAQYPSISALAIPEALELVLRRKAVGAEALAAQRDSLSRYPALKPLLLDYHDLRTRIAQETLSGPKSLQPEAVEAHRRALDESIEKKERLEAELARQIPEINLERSLRSADLHAVAAALPKESALVEIVHYETFDFKAVPAKGELQWKSARYVAFVLHGPDRVEMIDLGESQSIDQMISRFRHSKTVKTRHLTVVETAPATKLEEDGAELYDAVFKPIIPALKGCKRLFIAPDGHMTLLPFEVLPTAEGHRVIDDYHISYLSVGRDMLRFGAGSHAEAGPPVVVGDPDFDLEGPPSAQNTPGPKSRTSRDLPQRSFDPLSGARAESEQIARLLGVEPWLGGKALERRLKGCRSPRLLHLATHGFFLANQDYSARKASLDGGIADILLGRLSYAAENPLLRSGLVLAGVNTWLLRGDHQLPEEAEDGILTAEDVSGMDLSGTDLVVLSACETGLGDVQVGEGVFGLRRAFMLAGAKTLIMSLWKVPDEQTQELMVDFYQRILQGEPRSQALRQAQIAIKDKYPDPYYWGAFICQGEPGPIR